MIYSDSTDTAPIETDMPSPEALPIAYTFSPAVTPFFANVAASAAETALSLSPDFALFQETDTGVAVFMKIYNSLTRQKEEFVPMEEDKVKMYACGITVSGEAHVAHFTAMAKAGVKDVLHFSISSGLARTTSVAKEAAEAVKKEYPDFNMVSVDPLGATILQGMLVSLARSHCARTIIRFLPVDLVHGDLFRAAVVEADWGGRLLKCNGGAQRFPQNGWKSFDECKGIRELDCETDMSNRCESRT